MGCASNKHKHTGARRIEEKRMNAPRTLVAIAISVATGATVIGLPSTAYAGYGAGGTRDVWQVSISGNCDNPAVCGADLGGFWGWVEFDAAAGQDTTGTGDAQFTGCGHVRGGGGPGTAGAGHVALDGLAWHVVPADPQNAPPGAQTTFAIDSYTITGVGHGQPFTATAPSGDPGVDGFLGDSSIPVQPGHYALHPAPGVSEMVNVTFHPAQ